MTTIPDELLCEVFVLLSFEDRVSSTHVCKTWRCASLARLRTLWSCIVSDGLLPGVVAQQLDRAKDVPVDVKILLRDETFDDSIAVVTQHLPHIRRLCLYSETWDLGHGGLNMDNVRRVYASLSEHPAPILESLDINLPMDEGEYLDAMQPDDLVRLRILWNFDRKIPTTLFAGHAPLLRMATWKVMEPHPEGVPAFSGLTRLSYEVDFLERSHLDTILNHLPCLKALGITVPYNYRFPSFLQPPTFRLEELCIMRGAPESIFSLLEYLDYHRIRTVTTPCCGAGWFQHFVAQPRGVPHTLRIERRTGAYVDCLLQTSSGYSSHITYLHVGSIRMMAGGIFEQVNTLVIPVRLITSFKYLPPFPSLTCLSLVCRDGGDDVRRLGGEPRARRPVCPRLRELEFWGRTPPEKQLIVSEEDLDLFMRNVFDFGADGRPRVTLRNARLATTSATGAKILSVAETLTVSTEPISASFISDWRMRWQTRIEY